MTIQIVCPACSRKLRAPARMVGKKTKCPNCKTTIFVPGSDGPTPRESVRPPELPIESELSLPAIPSYIKQEWLLQSESPSSETVGEKSCTKCRTLNGSDAKFCSNCGRPLPTASDAAERARGKAIADKGCTIGCLLMIVIVVISLLVSPKNDHSSSKQGAVENSGWDDSVSQVKDWVTANVKDPDSLQFIEWSPVIQQGNGELMVRVKYRAKNSFGGYVVEHKLFFLSSSGRILRSKDF